MKELQKKALREMKPERQKEVAEQKECKNSTEISINFLKNFVKSVDNNCNMP